MRILFWVVVLSTLLFTRSLDSIENDSNNSLIDTEATSSVSPFFAGKLEIGQGTVTFSCPSYNVTNTNSAQSNYASCTFSACGGTTLTVTGCGACSGDQYLRLVETSTATQVASNDDGCSPCSTMTYSVPGNSSVCYTYNIQEGCHSSKTCSGIVTVTGSESGQIPSPTFAPTTIFTCPFYTASNTNAASQNYSSCSFDACGQTTLTVSGCGMCTGDQYLKLVDSTNTVVVSQDEGCGSGSQCSIFTYSVPSGGATCTTFTIQEGCYSNKACSGTVTVTGSISGQVSSPTYVPTIMPSKPTYYPSVSPYPSRFPTVKPTTVAPSLRPTYAPQVYIAPTYWPTYAPFTPYPTASSTTFTCPAYSAKNTDYATQNYAKCQFVACAGQDVEISGCGACSGDQYLDLYVDYYGSYTEITSSDDDCGYCSYMAFTATYAYGDDACFTYTIQEGCYQDQSCSGTVTVTGASYCVNCSSANGLSGNLVKHM